MPSLAGLLRLATQGALALLPSSAPQHTTTEAMSTPAILPATTTTNTVITTPSLRGLGPQKTAGADGPIDLGTGNLTWTGTHKEIRVNGEGFRLKGLSWFGFEVRLQQLVVALDGKTLA